MDSAVFQEFAKAGPWALAFVIAMAVIINAWKEDRRQSTTFLMKLNTTLAGLTTAVSTSTESNRAYTEATKELIAELRNERRHRSR